MESEESQAFAIVFGQVLQRARRDAGLSQVQLASAVGVVQSSISRIELGSLDVPLALLRSLSEALRVNPEALLSRAEENFVKVGVASATLNPAQPWWRPALQADLRGLASFVVSFTWEPL